MEPTQNDPIRHLVILGHPAATSFNRSVVDRYCAAVEQCGQQAVVRDLYAIGFDPLLKDNERPGSADSVLSADVTAELGFLRESDIITLVYPIWFGMPPAIIKGYVDRVLGAGFSARDIKAGVPNQLLLGKRLLQFSSSASTRPWLEEQGQWLSLRQAFDTYLAAIFGLEDCGHVHFDAIVEDLKPRFVDQHLERVREKTRTVCAAILSKRHEGQIDLIRHRPSGR